MKRKRTPEMIDHSTLYPALRAHIESERRQASLKCQTCVLWAVVAVLVCAMAWAVFFS